MPAAATLIRLATLAAVALVGTGCTHFANVTEVPGEDGVPTYVSSRAWEDGTPRTVVTERVYAQPDEPCDRLEVRREFYDRAGLLAERVSDVETCGVVLSRVVEQFDLDAARLTRIVQRDTDRDGAFDSERRLIREVGQAQLALLQQAAAE